MSNIEINATNIKKFSKRLQKQTKEKGISLSLAESHELLAKTLGCNNYDQLLKSINSEKSTPIKIDLDKSSNAKIYTYEEANENILRVISNLHTLSAKNELTKNDPLIFEKFITCLENLLYVNESSISLCYFQKDYNFKHFIHFETIFGDTAEISTGNIVCEETNDIAHAMTRSGFSAIDSTLMCNIQKCDVFSFLKTNKLFDFKQFMHEFSIFLDEKYGQKERHVFKDKPNVY